MEHAECVAIEMLRLRSLVSCDSNPRSFPKRCSACDIFLLWSIGYRQRSSLAMAIFLIFWRALPWMVDERHVCTYDSTCSLCCLSPHFPSLSLLLCSLSRASQFPAYEWQSPKSSKKHPSRDLFRPKLAEEKSKNYHVT